MSCSMAWWWNIKASQCYVTFCRKEKQMVGVGRHFANCSSCSLSSRLSERGSCRLLGSQAGQAGGLIGDDEVSL